MTTEGKGSFSEIEVEFGRGEAVAVVCFAHSALVNPRYLQKAQKELEELVQREELEILLIDLSDVDQAGSSLFGLILHLAEEGRASGTAVRLCSLQPKARRAFDLLNGGKLIEIFNDRRAALQKSTSIGKRPWWKFWG
ncbi:MAG: STAS domain-containing protein [Planctomycetota bacterium]|jgi:anti-anti-sigma factor